MSPDDYPRQPAVKRFTDERGIERVQITCPTCNHSTRRKPTENLPSRCPRNTGHGTHCYQAFSYAPGQLTAHAKHAKETVV